MAFIWKMLPCGKPRDVNLQIERTGSTEWNAINNVHELPSVVPVGGNIVTCQAALNPTGETIVALVTPRYAVTRQLNVTGNSAFSQGIRCGYGDGQPMQSPNHDMKMLAMNFGKAGIVSIQFLKETVPGGCCRPAIMSDFGTMVIPKALKGYLIVFFWPDDYPGSDWKKLIKGVQLSANGPDELPACALQTDEEARSLLATFLQ